MQMVEHVQESELAPILTEYLVIEDLDDDAIHVVIRFPFPYQPSGHLWRERLLRYLGRLEDGSDDALLAEVAAREDRLRYPARLGEALALRHQQRGDWLGVARALDWCGPPIWPEDQGWGGEYDEQDELRDRRPGSPPW